LIEIIACPRCYHLCHMCHNTYVSCNVCIVYRASFIAEPTDLFYAVEAIREPPSLLYVHVGHEAVQEHLCSIVVQVLAWIQLSEAK